MAVYKRDPNVKKRRPRNEKDKETDRLRVLRDPEKYREINRLKARRYRESHPEVWKTINKRSMEKRKDAIREWEMTNRAKRTQQFRERRHAASPEEKEKRRINQREKYKNNKEAVLEAKHLRDYGISKAKRAEMLDGQGGRCAICLKESGRWCLDHCHKYEARTGGIKIRGILCSNCNVMLGLSGDSIEVLLRAAAYLQKHEGG